MVQTIRNNSNKNDDWMKKLPGYKGEVAATDKALKTQAKEGSDTSGNWGHEGVPGVHGGSSPGGGHAKVGAEPGSSRSDIEAKSQAYREERDAKAKAEAEPKEPSKTKPSGNFKYEGDIFIRTGPKRYDVADDPVKEAALREQISKAMSQHPEQVARQVRYIEICKNQAAWEGACRDADLDPNRVAGFYSVDYDKITMPLKGTATLGGGWAKQVFDHEMGHAFWRNSNIEAKWAWNRAYKGNDSFDRHTAYATRGGNEEAFCETYMAYIARGGEGNWKSFDVVRTALNEGTRY